jgi:hypothetical protein
MQHFQRLCYSTGEKFHIRTYVAVCNPACAFTYHQDCHSCVLGRGTEKNKKVSNRAHYELWRIKIWIL